MTSQTFVIKGNALTWSEKAHQAGVFLTIALGFAIPVSTTLTDLLVTLVLVLWFLAGHYKTFVHQARHPLVRASLLLFLIFILAMIYTPVSFGEAGKMLKKYRELLYLIALIPFLCTEKHRAWAQWAFGLAMVVTLLVSFYTFYFPPEGLHITLRGHAFKDRINHSFLLAAFAFGVMTYIMIHKNNKRYVLGLSTLFILATVNLFFMVNGRTGYVLFYLLLIVFLAQQFKWRFTFYGLLVLLILNFGLISVPSSYQQRVYQTADNTLKYFNKRGSETLSLENNSIGQRLEFMINSYQLLTERPVFGYGTGSFKSQYAALAEAKGLKLKTANPHNEYLMTGVQTGLIGIGFLLYFIFCLFKYSFRLSPLNKNLALGLAAITAVACMGNSILLDHTPGIFVIYFTAIFFSSLKFPEKTKDA
jgi:O-antigen ligase